MLYAVYLAYHKNEVLSEEQSKDLPDYPPQLARVRIYKNKMDQLECYANTMCPASMTIEAENEHDLNIKINEMKNNFSNEEWLDVNIRPYI